MKLTQTQQDRLLDLMVKRRVLMDEIKRRAMIYQCEEKEYAATRQGLPFDTYHHMSYAEWAEIRAIWGFNGTAKP